MSSNGGNDHDGEVHANGDLPNGAPPTPPPEEDGTKDEGRGDETKTQQMQEQSNKKQASRFKVEEVPKVENGVTPSESPPEENSPQDGVDQKLIPQFTVVSPGQNTYFDDSDDEEEESTTKKLSQHNLLAWVTDAGSALGSTVLLASPSYLDIYSPSKDPKEAHAEAINELPDIPEEDIFDNPEYIDTVEGRLPLAEAARMIARDATQQQKLFSKTHIRRTLRDCYKRVVTIAFSFLFLFSAFFSLRNLQSSTGDDPKLGLVTYAALYLIMWLGGITSNPLVHRIRPKWVMTIAAGLFVLYPLAQFHQAYYTLVPCAMLTGFGQGLLWSAEGVYLMNVARTFALVSGKPLIGIIGKFNAIIFPFFMGSNVVGNLISSLTLGDFLKFPEEENDVSIENSKRSLNNSSDGVGEFTTSADLLATAAAHHNRTERICGLTFYDAGNEKARMDSHRYNFYVFYSIMTFMALCGTLTILFFLKKLKVAKAAGDGSFTRSFMNFLRMFKRPRSMLVIPLLLYVGLVPSFVLADYNAAFIACKYGISKIGYLVMTGYAVSVVGAFSAGRLVSIVGRIPLFGLSSCLTIASIATILVWEPEHSDSLPAMAFVPICLWCLSDGIVFSQVNGFLGELFKKEVASAMSMMSSCMTLGMFFSTLSIAFKLITLRAKAYIIIVELIIAFACYLTLEILLKKKKI